MKQVLTVSQIIFDTRAGTSTEMGLRCLTRTLRGSFAFILPLLAGFQIATGLLWRMVQSTLLKI